MHSIRASMQSVTAKRLSTEQQQQSIMQSAFSTNKTLNMAAVVNNVQIQQKTMANFTNETFTASTTTSNNMTAMKMISSGMATKKSFVANASKSHENYELLSYDNLDSNDIYAMATRVSNKKLNFECKSNNGTIEMNEDELIAVESEDQVPPALPVKTRSRLLRRDQRLSTYDNVDENGDFSE